MSGEASKSSGEYGEKIVQELLNIMGWNCAASNTDIDCHLGEKHKEAESNRIKHGIDNIVQYHCPLRFQAQQNLVISVKNRKTYPTSPNSQFKSFLKDISFALECFSINPDWQNNIIDPEIDKSYNWGVIFWLAYNELSTESIVAKIGDFNNTDDLQYDTVFLVDNKKANFIYSSYIFASTLIEGGSVGYYYPTTTYNIHNSSRENSGILLPVQFLCSSIIPFKIDSNSDSILLLTILEEFSEEGLSKIIGLAQTFTTGWASKTVIAFPDYHEQEHKNIVNKVKSKFRDKNFTDKTYVKSYPQLNIKALEEEQNV